MRLSEHAGNFGILMMTVTAIIAIVSLIGQTLMDVTFFQIFPINQLSEITIWFTGDSLTFMGSSLTLIPSYPSLLILIASIIGIVYLLDRKTAESGCSCH